MNWLNLRTSQLREPEFIGSEPAARATWLCVLAYCCELENGGRVVGARAWKDRQWQQSCGVTLEEIEASSPLLAWDSQDLIVWAYPEEKEAEIQAKREAGRSGGLKSGEARTKHSFKQNGSTASSKNEGKLERKENGIGKEPPKAPNGAAASPPLGGEESKAPKSEQAIFIASMFNRKPNTDWDPKEIKKFKELWKRGVVTDENLAILKSYYDAERPKGEEGRHRRDIKTFLNNFDGELDRARAGRPANGNGHAIGPAPAEKGEPARWRDFLKTLNSDFKDYGSCPSVHTEFRQWKEKTPE